MYRIMLMQRDSKNFFNPTDPAENRILKNWREIERKEVNNKNSEK